MFKNLVVWADDPITSIQSIINNPWIMELGDRVKNTHVWQAILTGDAGENIFLRSELFSNDGKKKFIAQNLGNFKDAKEIGYQTGKELLKKAGKDFKI